MSKLPMGSDHCRHRQRIDGVRRLDAHQLVVAVVADIERAADNGHVIGEADVRQTEFAAFLALEVEHPERVDVRHP